MKNKVHNDSTLKDEQIQDNVVEYNDGKFISTGENEAQFVKPMGLEHFDDVVTYQVMAAKKAGAKSIKLHCHFIGEITF